MINISFNTMAQQVEVWAGKQVQETRAHILVRALEVAGEHKLQDVRAFSQGCDKNSYAKDLVPILTMYALPTDAIHLRTAIKDIFNINPRAAWENWRDNQMGESGEDRAGVTEFLKCKGRTTQSRSLVA